MTKWISLLLLVVAAAAPASAQQLIGTPPGQRYQISGSTVPQPSPLIIKSTSATSGYTVFQIMNNAGLNLLRVMQAGGLGLGGSIAAGLDLAFTVTPHEAAGAGTGDMFAPIFKNSAGVTMGYFKYGMTTGVDYPDMTIANVQGDIYINGNSRTYFQSAGVSKMALTATGFAVGNIAPSYLFGVGDDFSSGVTGKSALIGSTSSDSSLVLGQGAANNVAFRWFYNATGSLAYMAITAAGYNNPIKIDASNLQLNGASLGTVTLVGSTVTVSSNGNITGPSQSGTGVYRNSSGFSVPDTTATEILFNASNYSQGSMGWTSKSTATVAGVYVVSCGVQWAGSATGIRQLAILTSGVGQQATVTEIGRAAGNIQSVTQTVSLAAAGTVSCYATQTSGGPLNAQASQATFGTIQKLW